MRNRGAAPYLGIGFLNNKELYQKLVVTPYNFGTESTRRGGKVTVLQKLMDQTKINTTMKYVHVNADTKRAAGAQLVALEVE